MRPAGLRALPLQGSGGDMTHRTTYAAPMFGLYAGWPQRRADTPLRFKTVGNVRKSLCVPIGVRPRLSPVILRIYDQKILIISSC